MHAHECHIKCITKFRDNKYGIQHSLNMRNMQMKPRICNNLARHNMYNKLYNKLHRSLLINITLSH